MVKKALLCYTAGMKISIVVPCFNEEEALPLFMEQFDRQVANVTGVHFEIVLVDDGSSDATLALSNALADRDSRVRVLSFSRNFGKEAALLAGLVHASGDLVAVMDADLQDPPELLVEMINILRETGCDCVAARRVTRAGEPPVRSFFARTFYKAINRLSAVQIEDGARDFRLMRREMVDAIISLPERRRFSKGLFAWVGFDVRYVSYENVERVAGTTKWSFWGLLRYALEGMFSMSAIPLALPFLLALALLLTTIVLLATRSWMAALLCAFAAVLHLCLGVFGQYLARIYWEAKKRPLYLLKENQGE